MESPSSHALDIYYHLKLLYCGQFGYSKLCRQWISILSFARNEQMDDKTSHGFFQVRKLFIRWIMTILAIMKSINYAILRPSDTYMTMSNKLYRHPILIELGSSDRFSCSHTVDIYIWYSVRFGQRYRIKSAFLQRNSHLRSWTSACFYDICVRFKHHFRNWHKAKYFLGSYFRRREEVFSRKLFQFYWLKIGPIFNFNLIVFTKKKWGRKKKQWRRWAMGIKWERHTSMKCN